MTTTHNTEGILLIDKPAGKNAFGLVRILRKMTGVKKIGHAGTLDPFATGVMVMLVGKNYTRLSDQFLKCDKEYIGTIHLGVETTSYDCDGDIVKECDYIPTREEIEEKLHNFCGEVAQIPPMFSAKKVRGQKLYDLARKGIEIERKPAIVKMETTLIDYNYPHLTVKVACSKGTYIRSIAHDLGSQLGCGGHLVQLRRTKSGIFSVDQCIHFDQLLSESFEPTKHLIKRENFTHDRHLRPQGHPPN